MPLPALLRERLKLLALVGINGAAIARAYRIVIAEVAAAPD